MTASCRINIERGVLALSRLLLAPTTQTDAGKGSIAQEGVEDRREEGKIRKKGR